MRNAAVRSVVLAGLAAVLLAAAPGVAAAATYHVSAEGDDAAAGTAAAPWRTLQRAADRVDAGDTVEVAPGRYQGFELRRSGTKVAPVRFTAAQGAIVDRDNGATPDGIHLRGVSHVVVEGFTVEGASRAGIRAGHCDHLTLRRNVVAGSGQSGIVTRFCDQLVVEDNEASGSLAGHGIHSSSSGSRPVLRGNAVWGNRLSGIRVNGAAGDVVVSGALIERNVVYENGAGGGAALDLDRAQDAVIRNNLLHDNHGTGVALYSLRRGQGSSDNRFEHNTVVMPDDGRWCLQLRDASTGNQVHNNVFVNAHAFRGAIDASHDSLTGLVSDHNAGGPFTIDDGLTVLSREEWHHVTGQDANTIEAGAAELFADPQGGDFRLAAGSPALDAGSDAVASDVDLEGAPRRAGTARDLGAYERCAGDDCDAAGDRAADAIASAPVPAPAELVAAKPAQVAEDLGGCSASSDGRLAGWLTFSGVALIYALRRRS